MVKALIFDFGQTLVDSSQGFRRAEKEAETTIFDDMGVNASWSEFLADYRELRQDFHAHSNFSRKALWQEVYQHYRKQPDRGLLLRAERDYWETVRLHTRPFPEARATLEQLALAYRLGMVTNSEGQETSDRHRLNLYPDLARLFEIVVVAGEVGVPPKPAPEPFLLCLKKLGMAPDEAVFIGDDWRIDICGAQGAGMRSIWLQHRSVARHWPAVGTAVPIITGLEQLLDLQVIVDRLNQPGRGG